VLRRSPMKRGEGPVRKTRIKPKKRPAGKFARIYGSKERVRWVKLSECVCCGKEGTEEHPNANHHTENGGQGRKADYHTIVSLCHPCHHLHHTGELGREREWWLEQARLTQERWSQIAEED
jgi:hypothetical protein